MALSTDFEIKEFDAFTLTGLYQAMGTALTYPCYEASIINESDTSVYLSFDGTNNHLRIGAGKSLFIQGKTRTITWSKGEYLLKEGTQIYIKHNVGPGAGIIVFNALMTR